MPKIKITEIDNTGSLSLNKIENIVYIPGKVSGESAIEPTLFRDATKFNDSTEYDKEDLSFKIALHLLKLGLQVLYEGFVIAEEPITIDWNKLADKSLYDIRFLSTGGHPCASKEMIECAAKRGDCVALLDHKQEANTVATVREFFEGLKPTNEDNLTYAAAFTPWFKTDTFGKETLVPASFGYLCAYARAVQTNPTWYAVAGSFRGIIPELTDVAVKYTNSEVEQLQARSKENGTIELDGENDNVGKAINPISLVKPFGYIIWGNRTLRDNKLGETLKATSFLNVRNLISELKKVLYNTARKYTFEQNDDVLWFNFKSQITPLLDKMKSGNGIFGYSIKRLKTIEKARLKAKIIITPIEAVEDFELEVALEDSLEVIE